MNTENLGFDSKLIHSGHYKNEFRSATVPIYQTSTFGFDSAKQGAKRFSGEEKGYIYTRIGNPTVNVLEELLADLENGYRGIAVASGMGAVSTVYMALLGQGDHIISGNAVYGPSRGVLEKDFSRFGVEASFVNTSNLEEIENAIQDNTKVIYIETPANPTLAITDIEATAAIAHKYDCLLVVDNTFCSPYLQRPLDLGADVVLHSLTKFINGHADVVGGAIIAKEKEVYDRLRRVMVYMGPNMDPHQAFLVIRGVKTLSIRIDKAQENAMKIAQYLNNHDKVNWVKFPGLESHPQHELAKKQMSGFGTMISFGVKNDLEGGKILMNNVHLATLAVSLGGVETLIQHPASMTHAAVSEEDKKESGITDDLVRYAVGIEDVNDLIEDLDQALAKI